MTCSLNMDISLYCFVWLCRCTARRFCACARTAKWCVQSAYYIGNADVKIVCSFSWKSFALIYELQCLIGDGQVSLGHTVVKPNAKKVRRINENIVAGFAGSTADAFTLMERLENKLDEYPGQLARSCVELAKAWRTDKYLRRLEVSACPICS